MAKWWERDINLGPLGRITPKEAAIGALAGPIPGLGAMGNKTVQGLGQKAGLNDIPFVGGLFGESSEEQAAGDLSQGFERARSDISNLYGQAGGYYSPYMGLAGAFPQMQQDVNAGMYSQPQYQMGQFNQGSYQDDPYQMGQFDQGPYQDQKFQLGQFDQGNYKDDPYEMEKFDFQKDPGYQFAMDQGLAGVRQAMGAQGLSESGAEMKELAKFSEGLASQRFGDAFDRWGKKQDLGMQAVGLGQTGLANRFNRYSGQQNLGMDAMGVNQAGMTNRFNRFASTQGLAQTGYGMNQQGLQNRYNRFGNNQLLGMQNTQMGQNLRDSQFKNRYDLANIGMGAINKRALLDMDQANLYGQMHIGQAQGLAAAKMAQAAGRRAFLGDAMGMVGSAMKGG